MYWSRSIYIFIFVPHRSTWIKMIHFEAGYSFIFSLFLICCISKLVVSSESWPVRYTTAVPEFITAKGESYSIDVRRMHLLLLCSLDLAVSAARLMVQELTAWVFRVLREETRTIFLRNYIGWFRRKYWDFEGSIEISKEVLRFRILAKNLKASQFAELVFRALDRFRKTRIRALLLKNPIRVRWNATIARPLIYPSN